MFVNFVDRIDTVFLSLIAAVTLVAFFAEIRAVWTYWSRICQPTAKALRLLRSHLSQDAIPLEPLDERVVRWLLEYLDGDLEGCDRRVFRPHRQRHRFALLTYPRVLNASVPRSPAAFAPTLLTALGVLGTFTGIYLGLQQVNLQAIASTETLLATSTQLLAGMQVAFFTSLCGLGGASVMVVVLAVGERLRVWRRNQLRSQLNGLAFVVSPTRMLARLAASSQAESAAGEELTELRRMRELQEAQLAVLQQSPLGEAFGERLREMLRRELLEPVAQQLQANLDVTQQTQATVAELSEMLSQRLEGSMVALTASVTAVSGVQQETLAQLGTFCDRLDAALGSFQTQSQTALDRSIQMQKELLDNVQERTADILQRSDRTFASQADILQSVGDETVKTMSEARSQLMGSLENIDAMLQNTRQTVEDELERFRLDYQYALDSFFSQQNELLKDTLVKQRQNLETAGDMFVESLRSQLDEV